jgi:hypothetical protein
MAQFKEWCEGLETALYEPFPETVVQHKSKGGSSLSFVAWHHYARRLNRLVGPGWSMGEPIMRDVGGKLVTALPITILGTTRVNFGSEDEEADKFGDAATNSWAQAFKRTCALFGMGLEMYDKTGAAARDEEQRKRAANDEQHARMVAFLREVGARCDEDVLMAIGEAKVPIKEWVRDNWKALKTHHDLATRAVVAVEESTGETFDGPT